MPQTNALDNFNFTHALIFKYSIHADTLICTTLHVPAFLTLSLIVQCVILPKKKTVKE